MGNALNYSVKITNIEDNANADLLASEVKSLYESNADTNVLSDAEANTLTNIPYNTYTAPTLLNGWVNYGGDYSTAGYMKDENGNVFIRGLVRYGTISTTLPMFYLPVGYRPSRKIIRAIVTSPNVMGRLDIAPDGAVIPNAGSNAWFSIEVNFKAEQ